MRNRRNPGKTLAALLIMLFLIAVTAGCGNAATAKGRTKSGTSAGTAVTAESASAAASAETATEKKASAAESADTLSAPEIDEHGSYTSKEDVALYLHTYGHLPENYITKKEAQALGWSGGSLGEYAPGKSIGGSRFGNYEGILPEKKGRQYYECDIDYAGKKRGAKRLVYSDDGLIFYTEDHYESFEQLY